MIFLLSVNSQFDAVCILPGRAWPAHCLSSWPTLNVATTGEDITSAVFFNKAHDETSWILLFDSEVKLIMGVQPAGRTGLICQTLVDVKKNTSMKVFQTVSVYH